MKIFVDEYLKALSLKYSRETSTEYSYRTEFETFIKNAFESIKIQAIDHDAKSDNGNKPDFVIIKHKIPILYIETKDIGKPLDKIEKSSQMARYYGYDNLVLTDYLEFRFYRNGQRYGEPIKIGRPNKKDRTITPIPENFELLQRTLIEFTLQHKEPIKSGLHLAKIMGGKAQRIRDNVLQLLDEENPTSNTKDLKKVYQTIRKFLIHDLNVKDFADMYAQTLVYGLFVARYNDETPENFTRSEARDLIPASNPFLRHFFDHIAGANFPKRLEFIVDELCEIFTHADIEKLMGDYYKKSSKNTDPVIHFYEDFLKEYDPVLRKKMGAYYTPRPVVQFIIKSVDQILKKDFGLRNGLADTTKNNGIHKVQVLDPAVGTGTFFSTVIGNIYENHFLKTGQKGRWPKYVYNDLLPRLHGFELMMAPYTIAHLKLSMAFKKTGFKYFNRGRVGIYLTNSLEDLSNQEDLFSFGFAESIAEESKEATKIKQQTPIMVIVGNPPYSGESMNKGKWIMDLMKDYKVEPGGKEKLKERNPKWINDDYVKFIRFAQHFIEKNGSGVLAYINPHGFLDNPTFRGMRWKLQTVFDKIYVLNLHGNAKKKEVCPDGSKDENVFDIQQGVSINIFVKTTQDKDNKLAQVYYADLWGKRKEKFNFLNTKSINQINFEKIPVNKPMHFMVPKNFELEEEYKQGFSLNELFPVNSVGIVTAKDKVLISFTKDKLIKQVHDYYQIEPDEKYITKVNYRPFDIRYLYYDTNLVERSRDKVMKHLLNKNLGIVFKLGHPELNSAPLFATNTLNDFRSWSRPGMQGGDYIAPLYLYENNTKLPNFNQKITDKITETIGQFTPEELFDYIYAILHSPTYRNKYKEFLKIDFPRVPYPTDKKLFKKLSQLGQELRKLHLMKSNKLDSFITSYPNAGSDTVEKVEYKDGDVWINNEQYFGNVPELAWNFYIGGYQPAQKWLKDRKKVNKTLTNEDIEHYQKIVVALMETDKIMKKIDKILKL